MTTVKIEGPCTITLPDLSIYPLRLEENINKMIRKYEKKIEIFLKEKNISENHTDRALLFCHSIIVKDLKELIK